MKFPRPNMTSILTSLATNAVVNTMMNKVVPQAKPPAGAPAQPGPIHHADPVKVDPIAVATAAVPAVIQAISNNPDVVAVRVKPMRKSTEGWTAIFGSAITLISFYGSSVLPVPVTDALDNIGGVFGLPPNTIPSIIIVGSFAVIWIRRMWFTKSITPAAADKAVATGDAV